MYDTPPTRSKKEFYSDPNRTPSVLTPRFDGIHVALRSERRWLLWKLEWIEGKDGKLGKWSKVPKRIDGYNAKLTDPATWTTFEAVREAYGNG